MTSELAVVRSTLYDAFPGLTFALSTRAGGRSAGAYGLNLSFRVGDDGPSVEANRSLFFGAVGVPLERLAVPTQVHGAAVLKVDRPGSYPDCDGLLTDAQDVYLAISVADCVPVFLFDPVRRAVAAIHAGWRGSRLGILAAGLEAMRAQFGSSVRDLRAVIGQSAGACCYEVGEDVAGQFDDRFVVRTEGRKPHLDLHAFHLELLVGSGVPRAQIELLTACTICHPEQFHSFRRDGSRSGRMMGVIGLPEGIPLAGK